MKIVCKLPIIGVVIAICVMLPLPKQIQAQTKIRLRLVDVQSAVDDIRWSDDSQSIHYAYQNASIGAGYLQATASIATNTLTRSKVIDPSAIKTLSNEERLLFDAGDAVAAISPNNRYAVFISSGTYTFHVADRQTRNVIDTKVIGDASDFNVLWNKTSSAFIPLLSFSGFPGGFYTNLDQGLSLLHISQIGQFASDNMILDVVQSKPFIFGVSRDGKFILAKASGNTPNAPVAALVLINGLDKDQSIIVMPFDSDQDLLAGAFSPTEDTRILAVTKAGLVEYDLVHRENKVLDSFINTDWATSAIFSPDGRWLAVIHNTTQDGTYLYVGDTAP